MTTLVAPGLAERYVLSALLMGTAEAIEAVLARDLRSTDFLSHQCASVYSAALALHERGVTIDPLTVANELEVMGWADRVGGTDFIADLIDEVPTAAHATYHAEIVVDASKRRTLLAAMEETTARIRDGGPGLEPVVAQLQTTLNSLAPASSGTLRLWTPEQIAELPIAPPVIEEVAFADSLILVVGKYASMKTFLMLDFALSIAHGRSWHGRRVQQGPVVYIFAEGHRGIPARVRAWRAAGCSPGAEIYFAIRSVMLTTRRGVAELLTAIRATGVRPVAIFVDTLARNMDGDEQSAADMGAFVRGCDELRQAFGAAVFVAHHTGWKADRSRGSSSLPSAADTEIVVERSGSSVRLTCTKQKDALTFDPIHLESFSVADSLVLRAVGPTDSALTANETLVLKMVQQANGMTSTKWMKATGLPKSSFQKARKDLLARGYARRRAKEYFATEAGRLALGTTVKDGPSDGQ